MDRVALLPTDLRRRTGKDRTQAQLAMDEQRSERMLNVPNLFVTKALTGRIKSNQRRHFDLLGRKDERTNPHYLDCRIAVLTRDNYTCQHCNVSEGEWKLRQVALGRKLIRGLATHHIKDWDNYPELRFVIENCLTLCDSCHAKEEKRIQETNKFQTYLQTRLTSEVPLEGLQGTQAIVYFKESAT